MKQFEILQTEFNFNINPNKWTESTEAEMFKVTFRTKVIPLLLRTLAGMIIFTSLIFIEEKLDMVTKSANILLHGYYYTTDCWRKYRLFLLLGTIMLIMTLLISISLIIGIHLFGKDFKEDLRFAMVTHKDKEFIVWNEFGVECQRLYLYYLSDMNKLTYRPIYSPYHMTAYSFDEDLLFFATTIFNFMVLPQNKHKSYLGQFADYDQYRYTSIHLLRNSSYAWLIGGYKFKEQFDVNGRYFEKLFPEEKYQSTILDLK